MVKISKLESINKIYLFDIYKKNNINLFDWNEIWHFAKLLFHNITALTHFVYVFNTCDIIHMFFFNNTVEILYTLAYVYMKYIIM